MFELRYFEAHMEVQAWRLQCHPPGGQQRRQELLMDAQQRRWVDRPQARIALALVPTLCTATSLL